MAQIYKRQVQESLDTPALDTSLMSYAGKKKDAAYDSLKAMADHTIRVEQKRIAQEQESIKDLTKKKALQAIKNSYELFGHDPKQYEATAQKQLKEIYSVVPDGPAKNAIMGEVQIDKSGYDARVQRKYQVRQEKIYNERYKDALLAETESAAETLSMGMFTEDQFQNGTADELVARAEAYRDAEAKLARAREQAYAVDTSGNFILSATERATITDRFDNRGMYAAIDYVNDNVQGNYEGAVKLRDRFKNNKKEVMAAYGMSEESYKKSIKYMDEILSGQKTGEQIEAGEVVQLALTTQKKEMGIELKDGRAVVTNKRYNNINSVFGLISAYEAAEEKGLLPDKGAQKEKMLKEKIALQRTAIDMVEEGIGVKGGRRRWEFGLIGGFLFRDRNVGMAAYERANELADTFYRSYGVGDKDEQTAVKYEMYKDIFGDLKQAGYDLEGKEGQEVAIGKANSAFINLAKKVVGEQEVPKGFSAVDVYSNKLLKAKNEVTFRSVQARVDALLR
jgi:hypothetical protein